MNEYTQPRSDKERRARKEWLGRQLAMMSGDLPFTEGQPFPGMYASHMAAEQSDPTEIDWLRLNREFSWSWMRNVPQAIQKHQRHQ